MPKAVAQDLEPKIIVAELPRHNTRHQPENEALAKARREQERIETEERIRRAREENRRDLAILEQQAEAQRQKLRAAEAKKAALLEKWKFDASKKELAKTIRKRQMPWDGRLETYRSIHVGRAS